MRLLALASCAVAAALTAAGPARAVEGHCMARILADVPAAEAPEQVMSKSNGSFGPIAEIKVDRQSGKMLFCGRRSYCYDSNAFELTTPCRLKRDETRNDARYFTFFTR